MAHRHRMHKRAHGGRAGDPFKHNYAAPGGTRIAEEGERGTGGFKHGGRKHVGKAAGGRAKAKAGFKRGGSVWSRAHGPFTNPKGFSAPPTHQDSGQGGHMHGIKFDTSGQVGSSRKGLKGKAPHQNASDAGYRKVSKSPLVKGHKDGGAVKKAAGGTVEPTATRKRGGAVGKKYGGECGPQKEPAVHGDGGDGDGEDDEDGAARGGVMKGHKNSRMHYFGGKGRHKAGGGHVDLYVTKGGTHHWKDDDHHRRHGGKS